MYQLNPVDTIQGWFLPLRYLALSGEIHSCQDWGVGRSSCRGSPITNPTTSHEEVGSIPDLAQWLKGRGIAVSCGVGCSHGLDLALLWLWHRSVATVPVWPLAWEPSYAVSAALKRQKNKCINKVNSRKKKKKKDQGMGKLARVDTGQGCY